MSPAAAANVGTVLVGQMSLLMVPGLMTPGQRITVGTRKPPSQSAAFSPAGTV